MKLTKIGKITHVVELSGEDIMRMLADCGTNYIANDTGRVEFQVPGGGDYSNERVDFTKEGRVFVTWETEE